MATVKKTTRNGAVSWQTRWRDPEGRQRKKTFPKKTDAERFLTTVEAAKLQGTYIDHSDKTTVAAYARTWASARPHRPSTARRSRASSRRTSRGPASGSVDWRPCVRQRSRRGPRNGQQSWPRARCVYSSACCAASTRRPCWTASLRRHRPCGCSSPLPLGRESYR